MAGAVTTARKPASDNIPNELILRFHSKEDLLAFLGTIRSKEIKVVGYLPELNAVRLRLPDSVDRAAFLQGLGDSAEIINNTWMYVPTIPEPTKQQPEGGYTAFGEKALEWMGVSEVNPDWGKGITVAILDTGVESHPALAGKTLLSLDVIGKDVPITGDYEGHATAVASILAGSSSDVLGMAPGSSLLSIRVAAGDGVGDSFSVAQGIVQAVNQGAQIINLSMGSPGDSTILHDAVDYAIAKGVLIIASTGNDALESIDYPARYEGVVAVSAVDSSGRHLYFANSGAEVTLSAPGYEVNAGWTQNQVVLVTGTSASAPFVAGAIAAVMSQNPGMTAADALAVLVKASKDAGAPGRDEDYGFGVLNLTNLGNLRMK